MQVCNRVFLFSFFSDLHFVILHVANKGSKQTEYQIKQFLGARAPLILAHVKKKLRDALQERKDTMFLQAILQRLTVSNSIKLHIPAS